MSEILEEMDEQQMANLLVLMKAKRKNGYSYLAQADTRRCPVCGEVFKTKGRGRPKKFCSDACRFAWKNKHPKPENWRKVTLTCPVCGQEFEARGYGDVKRKYCSRSCANHGRAMERRKTDG